ncbi:MAG: hypothetical protein ACPKPY_00045 [Nitrososphaeraceae archaeon]
MEELLNEFSSFFSEYSYPFVFLLIFLLSAIPILTPPTWMIVVSAYTLHEDFNPIILSIIGAIATTFGRIILSKYSSFGRKIISNKRKNSLERLKKYLEKTKYGYFLTTFVFAILPLPSNMLFISYGLMKVRSIGIIIGFFLGRFIVYLIMIQVTKGFFQTLYEITNNNLLSVAIVDIIGVIITIIVLMIDWEEVITNRKFVLIKPQIAYNISKFFKSK